MKTRRLTAAVAAAALGLSATLVAATSATAADFYVVGDDLGVEDAASDRGYPDDTWFTGQSTTGTQTSTDDGLVLTGRTMLLYGAAEIPLTGERFVELVQSAAVDADGTWSFQLPVYLHNGGAGDFATYRPASQNTIPGALDSQWISSADGALTLGDIATEIDFFIDDLGLSPALLAFGVLVDEGWDPLTLRSITFDGDTHFFTPQADDGEIEDAGPAIPVDDDADFTG